MKVLQLIMLSAFFVLLASEAGGIDAWAGDRCPPGKHRSADGKCVPTHYNKGH
jgi:hypothetical protein